MLSDPTEAAVPILVTAGLLSESDKSTTAAPSGTAPAVHGPARGQSPLHCPPSQTLLQRLNVGVALSLKAMARVLRKNPEIFSLLFVAVLFAVVSKVAQNSGATQSPDIPPPIFPVDSPVFEFNDGNMQSAMFQIQREDNEFSFVMYYAHWDGNSRDIAVQFDKAARRISHQVTFIAVNCWWVHGMCRNRIKTTMYPALLATAPTVPNGLQYTGVLQADEMVAFLQRLCRPFTYVTDMSALYRLHASEGTVVVGYFDWSSFPSPPGLASFQKAAWLALEKDVVDPVAFAVVTSLRLGQRLGMQQSQSIAMIRALNSTLIYPKDAAFRARLIVDWTYKHRENVVEWLSPAGVKSTIMSSQLERYPAVVLFTSHNPLLGLNNDFYWFKEIALDYYNCNNSTHIQNIVDEIHKARDESSECCSDKDGKGSSNIPTACDCCQTLANVPLTTMTTSHGRNVCQVCEQSSRSHPSSCSPSLHRNYHHYADVMNFISQGKASLAPNSCLLMNYYYSPFNQLQLCCKQCDGSDSGGGSSSNPQQQNWQWGDIQQCALADRSSGSASHNAYCGSLLSRTDCHTECEKTFASQPTAGKWSRTSNSKPKSKSRFLRTSESPASDTHAHLGPFRGLGCRTNKTVNFFAMRSEYFWQFAEQLGVSNISNFDSQGGKMAVVLLDLQAEQQHFLDQDLTTAAVKHFIFNYTTSNLTRHLRSTTPSVPGACSQASMACVKEVVSSTFEELVLDDTKDVVLLYYTPWCGFCARINHLYLKLARVFQNSSNLLIARIDGDANDLPWHLTPSSYPTLLLFPAGHKEQSLQFPPSAALNLPNMVRFVLQHTTVLL